MIKNIIPAIMYIFKMDYAPFFIILLKKGPVDIRFRNWHYLKF